MSCTAYVSGLCAVLHKCILLCDCIVKPYAHVKRRSVRLRSSLLLPSFQLVNLTNVSSVARGRTGHRHMRTAGTSAPPGNA